MVSTRSHVTPTPTKSSNPDATAPIPCLVTGGAGFLGKTLCRQLVASGRYDVTVFDINPSHVPGVEDVKGDLTDKAQVQRAVQGKRVIFHVATASPTGANARNRSLMQRVNVLGTENILEAAIQEGVEKLVFTSSASVVFDGTDLYNCTEERPYPAAFLDYYSRTKMEAERLVLESNGKGSLLTCALRPSAIFGEGDPLMIPSLVDNARAGKTKFMIGDGKNVCDFTYVENIAYAHVLAAEKLSKAVGGGQAYFVTNDEPRPFWTMMGDILEGLGYERPRIKIPAFLLFFIASTLEWIFGVLGKDVNMSLTSFRVRVSSSNRHFLCDKIKRDFGYKPQYSMQQALQRTLASFAHLRNPNAAAAAPTGRKAK